MSATLRTLSARDPALAYEAALDALFSELFSAAPRLRVIDGALRQLYQVTPDSERMPARRPLPVGPWGPAWRARLRTVAAEGPPDPDRMLPPRPGPAQRTRRRRAGLKSTWPSSSAASSAP